MVKTDPAMRKAMLDQRNRNKRQGVAVNKGEWKKGTIRILPSFGREVGREYFSVFVEEERKSITCPKTFGYPDPLVDWINTTFATGAKEAKQHLNDWGSLTREHWVPCVIRGDEGTPSAPNVRAFRFPRKTYEDTVLDWIVDEDIGEDITDPKEGRDVFVTRSGEGMKTKWKPTKLDPSSLSKSKAMRAKLLEVAKTFDVGDHFYAFSLEDYESAYNALTGEELPSKIREKLEKLDDAGGRVPFTESGTAESDDEEEDKPMRKKKSKVKPAKSRHDEEEEDDDSDEEDESDDEEDDEESDDEESDDEESDDSDDDEDDDEPAKGKKKKPAVKSKKSKKSKADEDEEEESDDDSDDEDDEDDEDDSDEESDDEDEPTKGKKKPAVKSKKSKADEDDEEEDDDSDEEEESDDSDDEDDDESDEDDDEDDDEEEDDEEEDDEPEEATPAVRGGKAKSKQVKPTARPKVKPASKSQVKPSKKGSVSSRIKSKGKR